MSYLPSLPADAALIDVFMNRLVDGLGITASSDYFGRPAQRLANGGYAGLKKLLDDAR